jgi:diguanylate cyclase (GGDEF)-like protein/PAS domain S-box-containing protein
LLLADAVIRQNDDAIIVTSAEGIVSFWNRGAERLYGYSSDEMVGVSIAVLVPAELNGDGQRLLDLALADEPVVQHTTMRVRKDGGRVHVSLTVSALRDHDGSVLGVSAITRNVTARVADKRQLRDRERQLADAQSLAGVGSWEWDLAEPAFTFSDELCRLVGWPTGSRPSYEEVRALIHPEDRQHSTPAPESVQDGIVQALDYRIVRPDGEVRHVSARRFGRFGEDGELTHMFGTVQDVTERHRVDAELRAAVKEAEIMQSAFSDAPGGVALMSLDGRFLRVNESLCQIFGRPEQEIVGVTSEGFSHPGDRATTAASYDALRRAGARVRGEKRYVRPDGRVVWASTTATALTGPDGELTHIVAHFWDITEQRAAEEQLRASEENLRNVAAVARELPSHENPRQAICAAATWVAGADIVQLWEPDGADHLQLTAATGLELSPDERLPLTGEITATAMTYHSREPGVFLDLYVPGLPISVRLRDQFGVASALYEPVIGRGGALGVLVVMWKTAISHASARVIDAVGLLATEAAAAIERADLTARLSAQADAEQLRLRQLLEGAPDAMIISDSAGLIHSVNDQTLRLLGYTREELIGESVDQLVPVGLREGHPRLRNGFIAQSNTRPVVVKRALTARHKDGTEIPVEFTLSPVHTDEGLLVMAALRDITDRLAAEVRLRAAEDQFRRAFDDAPIGMMIIGLDGRYLEVNDAFCAIVGHPRDQLIGLPGQSITHPDDLPQDEQAKRELVTGEAKSFVLEKRYINAAGHPVRTSVNATLIRDAEDRPQHYITQVQDITERHHYETQLRHMADHDPLTGLLNRRSFERELASHVARVKRTGATGAVLMIDLDNFKYYNDTQGHSAGDELIVRIGQALQTRLRETDVLVRLGGDEFAVLLPHEDRASAGVVAQDLGELIRSEAPAPIHGEARRITASIGVACFADGDRLTAEEIMVNADLAMYEAKENGRNRYAHYRTDEDQRPRIESQMHWAGEITQALAEDRFELLAQPIESLHGDGPTQYELLLRMRDAHGDRIPPGTFLYVAERLGLIQEIDRWVVAHAIDMLAEQRAEGRDLRFEVNLSGHSIGDPELLEVIETRLTETGVPPDRLIFEITETAAVANIGRAGTFARRLSELGCRFALDDFGAGFGSFYYLKHLPFDYLKIDGEFVRHCATNSTDRTLISAVVQIARGMGKQTIAEFVGDQDTVDILTDIGVDYGQGYFLGRPEPLAEHLAGHAPALEAGH